MESMLILIGESASGKTEIANYLANTYHIVKAITTTTRSPREKEKDGVDYYFLSKEEFLKRLKEKQFVEHILYHGNYYGTGVSEIAPNKCLILDPLGACAFQKRNDPSIITFYLKADEETRKERMKKRGDSPFEIESRLKEDRIHFAREKLPFLDGIIVVSKRTIPSIGDEINQKYKMLLSERGITL